MKISIAMATYNGAKYLQEQLDSFLAQTRLPDQLIITDDGSTDDTLDIVKRFAETAPFQVIYSQNRHNLGYAGNFNVALQKTTGDLVFLSDQDDVWFPEKIQYHLVLAEKYPEILLFMTDAELTDGELKPVGFTKLDQIYSAGYSDASFVMGCCCSIRKKLLDLILPIPSGYTAHDNWIVYFADGLHARMVDRVVMQYYRRHGANESNCIINSTKKITRLHVYMSYLYRLFILGDSEAFFNFIRDKELFMNGINRVMDNENKYQIQLMNMLRSVQYELKILYKRKFIREYNFFKRCIYALSYMVRGYYSHCGGLKCFIRDVIRPPLKGTSIKCVVAKQYK